MGFCACDEVLPIYFPIDGPGGFGKCECAWPEHILGVFLTGDFFSPEATVQTEEEFLVDALGELVIKVVGFFESEFAVCGWFVGGMPLVEIEVVSGVGSHDDLTSHLGGFVATVGAAP